MNQTESAKEEAQELNTVTKEPTFLKQDVEVAIQTKATEAYEAVTQTIVIETYEATTQTEATEVYEAIIQIEATVATETQEGATQT